jgi:predicted SAM-dependent methyltransferase
MGANLRVNLGCGLIPIPEYLNVDERELPGVDLIADVRSLPFQPETLTEIYAAHLIEHFTEAYLKSTLLPAWHRLLKPSGILRIVVPDAEGMIRAFSQGTYPFENLRTVTYGGQDYPGNFHYTMFSRESLRTILREARFNPREYSCVARPNGLCLEMEITATKLP